MPRAHRVSLIAAQRARHSRSASDCTACANSLAAESGFASVSNAGCAQALGFTPLYGFASVSNAVLCAARANGFLPVYGFASVSNAVIVFVAPFSSGMRVGGSSSLQACALRVLGRGLMLYIHFAVEAGSLFLLRA